MVEHSPTGRVVDYQTYHSMGDPLNRVFNKFGLSKTWAGQRLYSLITGIPPLPFGPIKSAQRANLARLTRERWYRNEQLRALANQEERRKARVTASAQDRTNFRTRMDALRSRLRKTQALEDRPPNKLDKIIRDSHIKSSNGWQRALLHSIRS